MRHTLTGLLSASTLSFHMFEMEDFSVNISNLGKSEGPLQPCCRLSHPATESRAPANRIDLGTLKTEFRAASARDPVLQRPSRG